MPLQPNQMLLHYRLLEKIGEGGMGVVWKAEDTRLGRAVAIKILPAEVASDPDHRMRFEREAKAIAALNHPNIVTIHSVEEADGVHFLTMELVEGKTLTKLIRKDGLSLDEFLELALPLANAVSVAHEQGVTHRDLKPANIMVSDEGRVKVLDFGLAKLRRQTTGPEASQLPTEAVTMEGRIMGTVPYMSPEQVQGKPLGHGSDIFSLGIILYELATGRRPFGGETLADVMSSILRDTPSSVEDLNAELPRHLGRIIRHCLAKDPTRRLQVGLELRNELEALTKEATETEPIASIAVLPFADMSPQKDQDYFCEGMSEEIVNVLAKIEGLHVASRTAAFQFKATALDIHEIGQRLNVSTLLEGSVRKAGERLRITVQLINVADGYHLWSERYDREMEDVFAIQDEIATAIAERLKVALVPETDRPLVKRPTENLEAYHAYLQGRFFWNRRQLRRALECFERAVALDPNYALAHAGVADAYALLGFGYGASPQEIIPKAKQAAERALELDDALAEAHHAFAYVSFVYDWAWPTAAREFKRAIELNPSYVPARYMYAFYLWTVEGRVDEAVAEAKRAVKIDPLDSHATGMLCLILIGGGRSREAIPILERAIENDPAYFFSYRCLGLAYQAQSMYPEAIAALEEAAALSGRDLVVIGELAETYALCAETQKAETILDELVARSRQEYVLAGCFSRTHLALGRKDEALLSLDQAYDQCDPTLILIKVWPSYRPLHGNPRFESLLQRIGWS